MAPLKTLADLITPDERTLRFTPLGLSTGGLLTPEFAAKFQQEVIASCDLKPDVPENTRKSFERLRTLHSYGVLFYEAFTLARDLSWLVMEEAFRERFVTYYDGVITFVEVGPGQEGGEVSTRQERSITVDSFEEVFQAVRPGGSYAKSTWRLKLSSTREPLEFRATFAYLIRWARAEGLLHGQHNRAVEALYGRLRNHVAHPTYHLSMPTDSARTIRDLAEIINRLWGHLTPGGRLYPAPLERQVLVVAWTREEHGTTHAIMRDYQLVDFDEPGDWLCVLVRAVWEDGSLYDFDALYERSSFPVELLWGPGRPEEALAWIREVKLHNEAILQNDSVDHLDRIFALRIHQKRASLAMKPEVALALPPDRQEGRWFLIRADFPNDAFAHVRHINNGVACGAPNTEFHEMRRRAQASSPLIPPCAVECVFDGSWEEMIRVLGTRFKITQPATLSRVRVPPRFGFDVARDVEAE